MTNKPEIDLLTIGDAAIDLYMKVEGREISQDKSDQEHPKICFYHGSKIPVRTVESNIAGNAVNVAIGANKLGLRTAIYSEMGDDEEALRVEKDLGREGIITEYLHRNKGSQTGIHPVIVYGGERTIFSHHEKRSYHLGNWPEPKWLYYTSVSPGFEKFQEELVKYLKENPQIGVAFNPGTFQLRVGLEGLRNIFSVTDVLFVNREEAVFFVGEDNTENLHYKLHELGPQLTVITDGSEGASGSDGRDLIKIPAYMADKPVVDKTGAGDSFASGALAALFFKKPLREVLLWGAVNSSGVIREIGAVHGLKSKEEIETSVAKYQS
jgi:sugar/nucleoside kinase (ribokinase family)